MRRALTPKPQSPSNATCDGSAGNIRKRRRNSATPDGLELAAALYGPTIRDRTGEIIESDPPVRVAPYTARPPLTPPRLRWQRLFLAMIDGSDTEIVTGFLLAAQTICRRAEAVPCTGSDAERDARRNLEAAVDAELGRRAEG